MLQVTTAASGYLALGYRQLFGEDARPTAALVVALLTGTAVYATKFLSGGCLLDGLRTVVAGTSIIARDSRRFSFTFSGGYVAFDAGLLLRKDAHQLRSAAGLFSGVLHARA